MSEITKEDAYLRFNKELMRRVRVVAAVIKAVNEKGEPIIFATQRGCSPLKGGWELIPSNMTIQIFTFPWIASGARS